MAVPLLFVYPLLSCSGFASALLTRTCLPSAPWARMAPPVSSLEGNIYPLTAVNLRGCEGHAPALVSLVTTANLMSIPALINGRSRLLLPGVKTIACAACGQPHPTMLQMCKSLPLRNH